MIALIFLHVGSDPVRYPEESSFTSQEDTRSRAWKARRCAPTARQPVSDRDPLHTADRGNEVHTIGLRAQKAHITAMGASDNSLGEITPRAGAHVRAGPRVGRVVKRK